jgi:hypothetical protein
MQEMCNKRKLISDAEKNRAKGDSGNELEIRLEKFERRARNFSASADAGVRFRNFLLRHGTHVQDRHSSISIQRNLLGNLGEPSVATRTREKMTSELVLGKNYSPLI